MFGKNPIRHVTHDPFTLAVESMFYTLQGEGPFSGMPALFIRLAGCNLACHFCDTQFETNAEKHEPWQDVVRRITSDFSINHCRFVVITGGEPMRQNITGLISALFRWGTQLVQIETAGTVWQPDLDRLTQDPRLVFVCSPKTVKVNQRIMDVTRHWKYIIRAGELAADGLPNRGTQVGNMTREQILYRPDRAGRGWRDTIWVSPCDDYDAEKNAANVAAARDSCLAHGYRLSLQVHKIVGVE